MSSMFRKHPFLKMEGALLLDFLEAKQKRKKRLQTPSTHIKQREFFSGLYGCRERMSAMFHVIDPQQTGLVSQSEFHSVLRAVIPYPLEQANLLQFSKRYLWNQCYVMYRPFLSTVFRLGSLLENFSPVEEVLPESTTNHVDQTFHAQHVVSQNAQEKSTMNQLQEIQKPIRKPSLRPKSSKKKSRSHEIHLAVRAQNTAKETNDTSRIKMLNTTSASILLNQEHKISKKASKEVHSKSNQKCVRPSSAPISKGRHSKLPQLSQLKSNERSWLAQAQAQSGHEETNIQDQIETISNPQTAFNAKRTSSCKMSQNSKTRQTQFESKLSLTPNRLCVWNKSTEDESSQEKTLSLIRGGDSLCNVNEWTAFSDPYSPNQSLRSDNSKRKVDCASEEPKSKAISDSFATKKSENLSSMISSWLKKYIESNSNQVPGSCVFQQQGKSLIWIRKFLDEQDSHLLNKPLRIKLKVCLHSYKTNERKVGLALSHRGVHLVCGSHMVESSLSGVLFALSSQKMSSKVSQIFLEQLDQSSTYFQSSAFQIIAYYGHPTTSTASSPNSQVNSKSHVVGIIVVDLQSKIWFKVANLRVPNTEWVDLVIQINPVRDQNSFTRQFSNLEHSLENLDLEDLSGMFEVWINGESMPTRGNFSCGPIPLESASDTNHSHTTTNEQDFDGYQESKATKNTGNGHSDKRGDMICSQSNTSSVNCVNESNGTYRQNTESSTFVKSMTISLPCSLFLCFGPSLCWIFEASVHFGDKLLGKWIFNICSLQIPDQSTRCRDAFILGELAFRVSCDPPLPCNFFESKLKGPHKSPRLIHRTRPNSAKNGRTRSKSPRKPALPSIPNSPTIHIVCTNIMSNVSRWLSVCNDLAKSLTKKMHNSVLRVSLNQAIQVNDSSRIEVWLIPAKALQTDFSSRVGFENSEISECESSVAHIDHQEYLLYDSMLSPEQFDPKSIVLRSLAILRHGL